MTTVNNSACTTIGLIQEHNGKIHFTMDPKKCSRKRMVNIMCDIVKDLWENIEDGDEE
jgi:hypothetical protein